MNITIRKVVDNAFKNHKPIFINISTYWDDILVQIWSLFYNFWPLKLYVQYEASTCPIHAVSKFQLTTFNGFLVKSKLINFWRKNGSFYPICKFLNHNYVTYDPPNQHTRCFFLITMLCSKFSFLGLTVFKLRCSVSQSVSVYSCTIVPANKEKSTFGIYSCMYYKVRYIGRQRKSEALTESWPSYFTHFCFHEVMHSVLL